MRECRFKTYVASNLFTGRSLSTKIPCRPCRWVSEIWVSGPQKPTLFPLHLRLLSCSLLYSLTRQDQLNSEFQPKVGQLVRGCDLWCPLTSTEADIRLVEGIGFITLKTVRTVKIVSYKDSLHSVLVQSNDLFVLSFALSNDGRQPLIVVLLFLE